MLPNLLRQQNALLGHHRSRNCSTLHLIAACQLQIVVNGAHYYSEGYTPIGASAILADIICPAWPETFQLSPRVKHNTPTVLAKQGQATLRSTESGDGDCTASIFLLAKAHLCQWAVQFLAWRGSGHFDDIISGPSEAYCILMHALVAYY